MRINKYIALATGQSRRAADAALRDGRVALNGRPAQPGDKVVESDTVTLDGQTLRITLPQLLIALNKPVGYVCSRDGQGSKTVYELIPPLYHHLKPVGRLDKDSSGLLLMTNMGGLANQLTHPRYEKSKQYIIELDKPLAPEHYDQITKSGVTLNDGPSQFELNTIDDYKHDNWKVTMREGRNRQIRRTFEALGYRVTRLHRISFGQYILGDLPAGQWRVQKERT